MALLVTDHWAWRDRQQPTARESHIITFFPKGRDKNIYALIFLFLRNFWALLFRKDGPKMTGLHVNYTCVGTCWDTWDISLFYFNSRSSSQGVGFDAADEIVKGQRRLDMPADIVHTQKRRGQITFSFLFFGSHRRLIELLVVDFCNSKENLGRPLPKGWRQTLLLWISCNQSPEEERKKGTFFMNQLSDPLGVRRRRNKNEKLVILLVQVEQILARLGNKKKPRH